MRNAPATNPKARTNAFARFLARREQALTSWEEQKPRRSGRGCYHAYTRLFVPFAILVLIALPLNFRGLIWNVDGIAQYYPFFVYEGQWIRGIFSNLLGGNGLQIPLWEWTSGYGADVITTFDVFLDPLNLVSAITPERLSEWVFQLLVLVRMYLAGLAFVFYCRTRGEDRMGTVLGALLYALCGAALTGIHWSSGLHALMLFPVVLAGAERILAGKRPWVFVASLTLLAIISYYFTYMVCILLVGYLLVRVVMVEGSRLTPRIFLRWVGIYAGLTVLCLVLAGFALVPAACALMGMDRLVDRSTTTPLVYSMDMYGKILASFLSTSDVGSDTYQGFGGLAFLAIPVLFSQRGKNRALKVVLVTLTAFFFIPAVGSLLNVLNYATNRWAWAYALCIAVVLARMTPSLLDLAPRERKAMVIGVACYALILLSPRIRTESNVAGFAALLAALLAVLLMQGSPQRRSILTCTLAFSLALNGFYLLSRTESDTSDQQNALGAPYHVLTRDSLDSIALDVDDPTWWRYDAGQSFNDAPAPINRVRNNSLVLGLNGIDFYNSVYNSGVDAFHTELAIAGDYINFSFVDLQSRSDLMSLLGVKYFAYRKDGSDSVPYSFSKEREVAQRTILGTDYRLLQSDSYLPFGSTFNSYITREDYLSLSPCKRQQALLQSVVLEQEPTNGTKAATTSQLAFEDTTVPYTIAKTNGVTCEDGVFDVKYGGATVTLEFEGTPDSDTFLFFEGLKYRVKKPSEKVSKEELEAMSLPHRVKLFLDDVNQGSPFLYGVEVHGDGTNMTGYVDNFLPTNHMYGGKDTWLVTIGYSDEPTHKIDVTFNNTGIYTFDSLQVITQAHAHKREWVEQHASQAMRDVKLATNQITGTIDLVEPRTMLIPVAYGSGWKAFVDGQEVPVLRADTAFMALDLAAGHHDIEMRYQTPGLLAGFAVTAAGVVVLVALALILRRHR